MIVENLKNKFSLSPKTRSPNHQSTNSTKRKQTQEFQTVNTFVNLSQLARSSDGQKLLSNRQTPTPPSDQQHSKQDLFILIFFKRKEESLELYFKCPNCFVLKFKSSPKNWFSAVSFRWLEELKNVWHEIVVASHSIGVVVSAKVRIFSVRFVFRYRSLARPTSSSVPKSSNDSYQLAIRQHAASNSISRQPSKKKPSDENVLRECCCKYLFLFF